MKAATILTLLSAAALAGLAAEAAADEVKIGYINKMGDHPWFVAEVAGAKAAAEAAGAAFVSQDVQFNADLTVTTFDNRGAGESDQPAGPYTVEMLAADTADMGEEPPREKLFGAVTAPTAPAAS